MDLYKTWAGVHGPGQPLIFKRKPPLLNIKIYQRLGNENTDSYLFINIPWLQICARKVNFVYKIKYKYKCKADRTAKVNFNAQYFG